jgi:hypothetical protein
MPMTKNGLAHNGKKREKKLKKRRALIAIV